MSKVDRIKELEAALYRAAGRFSVVRGQGAKEACQEIMQVLHGKTANDSTQAS